jgi:methyl-accepting chemotaxis protein
MMSVVLTIALVLSQRGVGRLLDRLEAFARVLERDGPPFLSAARSVAEDATQLVGNVREEVDQIVATSRDLRARVSGAADALDDRVRDLEAVLDVLQEEVEETALDVAAALRATRRGASLLRGLKRAFLKGRG